MVSADARGCYCKAGDASCGTCERCGQPGHTRHAPAPFPTTGAWCDVCYRTVARRYRLLRAIPVLAVVGAVVGWRACAG